MDEYQKIVKLAATQKLIELYKFSLDVLDELIDENRDKTNTFRAAISGFEGSDKIDPFVAFLEINEDQKRKLRKKILDRGNDLIREMEQ